MKKKVIKTDKDWDTLKEGEVGVVKEGTFKFKVAEEKATRAKQKTRA